MGLLDMLQGEGGMRLGLGLLAAGGPTTDPNKTGLGARLQQGIGYYDDFKKEQEMARRAKLQEEFQAFQMEQAKAQLLERQAAQEAAKRQQAGIPGLYRASQTQGNVSIPQMGGVDMFSQGANVDRPSMRGPTGFDVEGALKLGLTPDMIEKYANLNNLGKQEAKDWQDIEGPNGAKIRQAFDKFAQPIGSGVSGYVAPVSVNQGDRTTFVKPAAGVSLPMGMSPDSKASNALGWANNSLSRERLNFDKAGGAESNKPRLVDGQWVTPPSAMAPGSAVPAFPSVLKKDATEAIELIKTAREIIPKSTGSYIGAGVDQAARVFGVSTNGDTAAAQLKALEGALVSKMPKMSGPQSDKDVLLYKQMAGEIGDPTIPAPRKLAALQVIEQIQQRHSGVQAPSMNITPTSTPTMRWNPKTNSLEMVS